MVCLAQVNLPLHQFICVSLLTGFRVVGKTSLIHAIAGELGLDIYVVSLSGKGYALFLTRMRIVSISELIL
jgi:hypothetical protein